MRQTQSNKPRQPSYKATRIIAGKTYLSSKKAAEYLGVTTMCLHNHVKRHRLKRFMLGGIVLYQQECLDSFINDITETGIATRPSK